MSTQNKARTGQITASRKLYSIHAWPNGREFVGKIEARKADYQLAFTPRAATIVNRKLVLNGSITIKSPNGQQHKADNVIATLLATQGSASVAPPLPRSFAQSIKPATSVPETSLVITEATGELGSVGVMYLKLSGLDGKALRVPMDLNGVQLNVRLSPASETERDLQWLYSALIGATMGDSPNEENAANYLAEINRILKS
jgi:hypothetical protein